MKALLLGSGGREYTICHQLAKSPHKPQLFIAPGNAGTTQFGKNIEVSPTDFEGLKQAAKWLLLVPKSLWWKGWLIFLLRIKS
jgi:phosphoribosylamine-glycine ligase